jgi:hypothetical protein
MDLMSIQIEVPFDALKHPAVAKSLADLMAHLGDYMRGSTTPAPATDARRRPRTRRGAAPDLSHLPASERWNRYVEGLPEASRKFLNLLEERGRLTVAEAVAELNLATPKAMGGLTGAMARWAPKQGVTLPFEASKSPTGERCWFWRGHS